MFFITTAYGKKYLQFLITHLYSIKCIAPNAHGLVLWRDIPPERIKMLRLAFPSFQFKKSSMSVHGNIAQRISSKTALWREALCMAPQEAISIADCDTVYVRSIEEFFKDDFDVAYTWKPERFPLNTGVLLIRTGSQALAFMDEWHERTQAILRSGKQLESACSRSGAADQQALRDMLDTEQYDKVHTLVLRNETVILKGYPCSKLNQTTSAPITNETHIVHYKAGWHKILLEDGTFTKGRPKLASKDQIELWNTLSCKANSHMASTFMKAIAQKLSLDELHTDAQRAIVANLASDAAQEATQNTRQNRIRRAVVIDGKTPQLTKTIQETLIKHNYTSICIVHNVSARQSEHLSTQFAMTSCYRKTEERDSPPCTTCFIFPLYSDFILAFRKRRKIRWALSLLEEKIKAVGRRILRTLSNHAL